MSWFWAAVLADCMIATTGRPVSGALPRSIAVLLSAASSEEVQPVLAPGYRLWFEHREGPGLDREQVLAMLGWDLALQPTYSLASMQVDGRQVVVELHEENDFTRLLGFAGWDAKVTFWLDDTGLIAAQLFVPASGQEKWEPYLERALPWLRVHEAQALGRTYHDGRLVQSPEAAHEWVRVLTAWRRANPAD